jgi:hypothetical protein
VLKRDITCSRHGSACYMNFMRAYGLRVFFLLLRGLGFGFLLASPAHCLVRVACSKDSGRTAPKV